MNKNYIYDEETLKKLEKGMEEVVEIIKYSFGPMGKHIVVINKDRSLSIVKDGENILKNMYIEDDFESVSLSICTNILKDLYIKCADGSKETIFLANCMIKEALKTISTGVNPNLLIKGMERIVEFCVEEIKNMSVPLDRKEDLENVLKVALQDEVIAKVLISLDVSKDIVIEKDISPIIYIKTDEKNKISIGLGDINDIEYQIRLEKITKGINLIRLNKDYGYCIGGESVYVKLINKMQNSLHTLEIDERVGGRIVIKALEAPLKQLAYNSSLEGEIIVQMVKMAEKDMGYDVKANKLLNLREVGILEFTNVLQESLISAVSIASKIILSSGIIAGEKVPKVDINS